MKRKRNIILEITKKGKKIKKFLNKRMKETINEYYNI